MKIKGSTETKGVIKRGKKFQAMSFQVTQSFIIWGILIIMIKLYYDCSVNFRYGKGRKIKLSHLHAMLLRHVEGMEARLNAF
jgi:hypothetical protein